jgi:hypothetical protein
VTLLMALTQAQKRSAADSSDPLCHTGILEHVLSYVGPGHWWLISTVCRLWKDIYRDLEDVQMSNVAVNRYNVHKTVFACVPQMMLFSAVFATPATVTFAHEIGFSHQNTVQYQFAAGRCADTLTLAAAVDVGMQKAVETTVGAAYGNTLAVMQFLHAEGWPWHQQVAKTVAARGDLEMLRWIREHGCPWVAYETYDAAAGSGNIPMVKWIKEQVPDVYISEDALSAAASNGHTDMCAYLHSENCPHDEWACDGAAYGGHIDTLRWLREHDYPMPEQRVIADAAAKSGSVEVMQHLQAEGLMSTAAQLTQMLAAAGAHNKLAAAQWLREQGAEWPTVLRYTTHYKDALWRGETLAWARAEGCTAPTT